MTMLKYLVRGSTIPSQSPSLGIKDPQPTDTTTGGKPMLGQPSFDRLGMLADVHAQPADPKRSLLKASLELGGVALLLYAAQAAMGFSVGFVLPWLFYFGVIHR